MTAIRKFLVRGAISALFLSVFPLGANAEWVELFDGKSLDGWTQRGGEAKYAVADGAVVGTTVPKTPNSFLCTDKIYGDFILELEFKVHPDLNSGVQIRSNQFAEGDKQPVEGKEIPVGRVYGYQVEIDPSDRAYSAGLYDEGRRGWLDDHKGNDAARFAFRQGEWNHYRIEAIGDRIKTFINGVPAADLTDGMTAEGFIALQVHGVGDRSETMQVSWRNIRIDTSDGIQFTETEVEKPFVGSDEDYFSQIGEIEKLGEDYKFTEGPALGPDGKVYFSDIPNERIMVFDPGSKKIEVFREQSGRANGLLWTPADALIACEGGNRRVTRTSADGTVSVIADSFKGKKLNSPNDCALDFIGGVYFTDPRYGKDGGDREIDVEAVYYIDRRGKVSQVAADLAKPNGIIFSPDYATLYVADPGAETIWAYDVVGEGKIENRRKFAPIGSDGMTMDKRGNVYCTWKGEVWIYNKDGKELKRIAFPEGPANCTLIDSTLYVTARTGFYAVDMGHANGVVPLPVQ
jgi:sugar lactone lactonase YvrE